MTAPQGYVPGRHKIDDYGNGGFRFADMSHRGSILALPTGIRAIAPTHWKEIDAPLIDIALREGGGIDLFIAGMGKDLMPLPAPLRAKLREAGVGCESMATAAAVRTFNMLLDEGRQVGALLIAV
jgi:uncharacterized protein